MLYYGKIIGLQLIAWKFLLCYHILARRFLLDPHIILLILYCPFLALHQGATMKVIWSDANINNTCRITLRLWFRVWSHGLDAERIMLNRTSLIWWTRRNYTNQKWCKCSYPVPPNPLSIELWHPYYQMSLNLEAARNEFRFVRYLLKFTELWTVVLLKGLSNGRSTQWFDTLFGGLET